MTELQDIIKREGLSRILEFAKDEKQSELITLYNTLSIPTIENDNWISFVGWKVLVSSTIYEDAKPNEIISGFEYLQSKGLAVDVYTDVLFVRSLYNELFGKNKSRTNIDKEKVVSPTVEPEILEFLRFCYWINKCKNTLQRQNFETKFNNFKNTIQINKDTREKIRETFPVIYLNLC